MDGLRIGYGLIGALGFVSGIGLLAFSDRAPNRFVNQLAQIIAPPVLLAASFCWIAAWS